MKQRALSIILSLTMVVALLASIAVPAYAVGVGFFVGGQWLEDNGTYDSSTEGFQDIIASGSIVKDGNTLTLNNVTINSDGDGIRYNCSGSDNRTATIVLNGKNTINSSGNYGINVRNYDEEQSALLTIKSVDGTSKGSLEIVSGDRGICSDEVNLSIDNCEIKATGVEDSGIMIMGGTLAISGSTVEATGDWQGIFVSKESFKMSYNSPPGGAGGEDTQANGYLTITNSTVTATATVNDYEACGIWSWGMMLTNSTVNASSAGAGIFCWGNITAEKSKIKAKMTGSENDGFAIAAVDWFGLVGFTPKINLSSDMTIKKGGKIVDINENIEGVLTKVGQAIGPDTAVIDESVFTNFASEVEITCAGALNVQAQKPASISSLTLPSDTDLKNAVLTDADKAAIANGSNIDIKVQINSIQAPSDANKVQQNLGSNTLGMYLDISIIKSIDGAESQVHNLNAPIRITFTIPDNLKGKDKYYVIRVHNGVTTVLNDLDSDPNTVTFETDRFSTYALVYSDTANTGDSSNIIALAVMALSSLGAVAYIERKRIK